MYDAVASSNIVRRTLHRFLARELVGFNERARRVRLVFVVVEVWSLHLFYQK